MDLGLTGKVAMVMGASRGIGKAVAMGLAKEGACVSICARANAALEQAAAEIRRTTGAKVLGIQADVAREEALERWVQRTIDALGPPQIVVTNTGHPLHGNFFEVSEAEWRKHVDSILMSVVNIAHLTVPHMRTAHWGRLITLTSAQARMPQSRLLLSCSIRNAVIGLTKCLSNEFAADGITVNSVLTGRVITEIYEEATQAMAEYEGITLEEAKQRGIREVPAGRLGSSEEFANVVVFLASERSSWVTGVSLRVDGGFCKGVD
jgi:3-oxoacyl-[acyl-carrier protein] reductase